MRDRRAGGAKGKSETQGKGRFFTGYTTQLLQPAGMRGPRLDGHAAPFQGMSLLVILSGDSVLNELKQ